MPRSPNVGKTSRNRTRSNPITVESQQKIDRALELRKAGATFQQIADVVGYADKGTAWHAVMNGIRELPRENAEQVLLVELERCDTMLVGLWPKAKAGHPQSVLAALRVMDRRARYLGLDDFEARMADVAERRVQIEERQAEMLAGVVEAICAGLLHAALRELADVDGATSVLERVWPGLVGEIAPRELRAVSSVQAAQ